jgi:hypothetical protein
MTVEGLLSNRALHHIHAFVFPYSSTTHAQRFKDPQEILAVDERAFQHWLHSAQNICYGIMK